MNETKAMSTQTFCCGRSRPHDACRCFLQVHKARLRLHKPPPRRWWQRQDMRQQAEFYQSLPQAAVAATQARLAQGANSDGTVAVKVTGWAGCTAKPCS